MIFFLIEWIRNDLQWKVPQAFLYTSTRMMLAALTALLLSILLGPSFIRKLYSWKIGQPIRTDECPPLALLHGKKKDTPTMGGILILFSFLVAGFIWGDLTSPYLIWLFITTLVLGLLGGRDDYLKLRYQNAKGISGKKKLLVQAVLALAISGWLFSSDSMNGVVDQLYIPFYKEPIILAPFLMILLIVFVIVGASNSVNLTDGLDGLAIGCIIMVASALALFAFIENNIGLARYLNIPYIEGSGEIAVFLSAVSGAGLGFLWYNGYPAQLFMGDIGSLTLGGVLGVSAVFLKRELLLGLLGAIFVVEAISVILQVVSFRFFGKRRIFLCAPLHHHFEYKGWPETKVTLRFWIIGLIFVAIGLLSLKFQ